MAASQPPAVPLRTLAAHVGDETYEQLWELMKALSLPSTTPDDKGAALLAWTRRSMSLLTQLFACIACVDSAGATGLSFSEISRAALAGVHASDAVANAVTTLAESKRYMHLRAKPPFDVDSALSVSGVQSELSRRGGLSGSLGALRRNGLGGSSTPSSAAVIAHVLAVSGDAEDRARLAHAARLTASSDGTTSEAALRVQLEAAGVLQSGGRQRGCLRLGADRATWRHRVHRAVLERLPLCVAAARHLRPRLCVRTDRDGAVELCVTGEFSATLTFLGYGLREPWAVVSVRLDRGGSAEAVDKSSPNSAYAAAQDSAVAEALQRALLAAAASAATADSTQATVDAAEPFMDDAFVITHRICHAAWSALSLQARAVAAGALARTATPPSSVTSVIPRALMPSGDDLPPLAFRRRVSRWRPGSVSLLYYPRLHSLLLGLWHAAALPAADSELERSLALLTWGDCDALPGPSSALQQPPPRCPAFSCGAGDAVCLARHLGAGGGVPFVPRLTVSTESASKEGEGGLGASDPIMASLRALLSEAAAGAAARPLRRRERALDDDADDADDAAVAGAGDAVAALPMVLAVDEWGLVVPLGPGLMQQQRGVPLLSPGLRAALSLAAGEQAAGAGVARVGPAELASALRRAAAAGAAGGASTARLLSEAISAAGDAAASRHEDASGVVVRATGELIVRRGADGSARARLEKAPVLANQRVGGVRSSSEAAGAPASAPASRFLGVSAGAAASAAGLPAVESVAVGVPPLIASSAAAHASLRQPIHTSAALVLARNGALQQAAGGGAPLGPVARFAVATAEPPPAAPPSSSTTGSLELAIASLLSADVLGSAPVAPPLQQAGAAAELTELAEQDGLSVGPPEDTDPESVLRACAYRPPQAAYWPALHAQSAEAAGAPAAGAPPPAASAVLGCLCIGEVAYLPSPSAAASALDSGSGGAGARGTPPRHEPAGVLVRALPPPAVGWAAPLSCGTDATALPRLWQRLALQRSSAIARVAAALVAARPDLQAALPQGTGGGSALRLTTLPAADADLAPFADGEGAGEEGLQLCIALPAASARAGRPLLLRVWVDPASAAVRLSLAADHVPSAGSPKRLCADAAPLCALALECAHHAQARLADRVAAVAHAIAASDRTGRAALRESLQAFARARRHGASSATAAAGAAAAVATRRPGTDAAFPGPRPPPRKGSIDGAESVASASTGRGSVSGGGPSQLDAAAAATAAAVASAHVGRPGLITPLALGMEVFRSGMASGAGADARSAFEVLRGRIGSSPSLQTEAASQMLDEEPSAPLQGIPAILQRRGARAAPGGSSALGSSSQLSGGGGGGGGSTVVAAVGVASLHGWEVLSLLGCHGSAPLSVVSAVACGLLRRGGHPRGPGAAALTAEAWLAIPAFRPSEPPALSTVVPGDESGEMKAAAAALVREAEALFGTPSPRDAVTASLRSAARLRANARGSEGTGSLTAQRESAIAEVAAARIRHGTAAAITAKLGAAAAVAVAEEAVRAAHLIEAAAGSNSALDAAFSALRRVNAAEPVTLRARLLIATPLPLYETPELVETAMETDADVLERGAVPGRKRPRERTGGDRGEDDEEGAEDSGSPASASSAPPPLSRCAALDAGAAEVAELCSPRCGLTLPLGCFLQQPPRSRPFSSAAPPAAALRAVVCVSVSLQPRWDSAAPFRGRRFAGVRPTLVMAVPPPAEVGLSWTVGAGAGVAGGTATSSSVARREAAPVRLDPRHLLAVLAPAPGAAAAPPALRFEGIVRLLSPPETPDALGASPSPAPAAPGPLVVVDLPLGLLRALDARAAVDAALTQRLPAADDSPALSLAEWAARTSAAARRAHPTAVGLVALVLRQQGAAAPEPLLPPIPLTLRCDADGGGALPIVVAWAHSASQLSARAAASSPAPASGELSFPSRAASSGGVPALLLPVAAVRLIRGEGVLLPAATSPQPVGNAVASARGILAQAAARLRTVFDLV